MRDEQQKARPDTSKNGMMKKRQLAVKDESIKERGRQVLNRLGKKEPKE
ncbi:hypothetical protein BRE01_15320 [Brevibacillus reuszeri]|uniref:Spore protein n=1 Tax=Brevibacillus reuszeri TaxID=54915 RepID=A0ABQ0TJ04_9BACL|nr:hypothetical protein [Brevibacillus reuszeri]MED1856472.1 hypothetical protein [Brevibacillus reuszeri]GED67830.1 hypothetical protein BRE01_15320 [Brevibacillus reuszeri]